MDRLATGRPNLAAGLLGLAAFMAYGFVLIYLRDFGPSAAEWAATYGIGTHFEARLAHVHGALFSVLNLVMGLVLPQLGTSASRRATLGALTLAGLGMPVGILAEVLLGAPPVLVLVGGGSMFAAFLGAGILSIRSPETP